MVIIGLRGQFTATIQYNSHRAKLQGATTFTKLNLSKGYFHITLAPSLVCLQQQLCHMSAFSQHGVYSGVENERDDDSQN
uniref:Uncharacterized protein n=1 Tax=Romanomermis culicivorax TaxID=13658 RepID=A0A915JFK0_ROMCU